MKWNAQMYHLLLDPEDNVAILRYQIFKETQVKSERQKILNLKGKDGSYEGPKLLRNRQLSLTFLICSLILGKKVDDTTKILDLDIKTGKPLMMVGSREADIESVNERPEGIQVVNDFDDDQQDNEAFENKEIYLSKIRRRIKEYKIEVYNQPREGKKLLVLDIDYTLFDHRSSAETGVELMRPYLHEFLTSAYEHYDIVIWSATSMKWIVEKMKLLGVHNHENYKILFYLDSSAMITVHCPKRGVVEVKPLMVVWGKYLQYSSKNTIMFDDIRRNFLMNPKSGLRIKPFSNCHVNREKDKELLKLATYLKDIAEHCDDFNNLNHRKWEGYRP